MAVAIDELRHLADRSETGRLTSLVLNPAQYTLSAAVGPKWHDRIQVKLLRLVRLQDGWDSYGGARISPISISVAADVLGQGYFRNLPEPQIVPTSHGHVQAEWMVGDKALEIEFVSDTEINVCLADSVGGSSEETLNFDLSPLADYATELMT